MRVNKATMLLAIITCLICIIGGYVLGNSKREQSINIFQDKRDTITTRDYTLDVYTNPTENVFRNGHIQFRLTGNTVTRGLNNE